MAWFMTFIFALIALISGARSNTGTGVADGAEVFTAVVFTILAGVSLYIAI